MASSAFLVVLCASTACALTPVKAPASTQPRNNILSVPERIAQKRQELGDRLPFTTEQLNIEEDTTTIGSLEVPSVALGTISWTPEKERTGFRPGDRLDGKVGTEEARAAVATAALEEGLTFFDTAERYSVGVGETLLADALADGAAYITREMETDVSVGEAYLADTLAAGEEWFMSAKQDTVVATKFTPTPWRRGAQSVVDACEASRKRLGVEQIDLYQIHMPDVVQPGRFFGFVEHKDEEYWEGLARCAELGLVREIGVSNYGPTLLRRCSSFMAKRGLKIASNQIHYSLLARTKGNNQATVDAANELGIRTLAYYPLAMGLLTDKGDQRTGALEHYATGGTGFIGFPFLEKNQVKVPQGGVKPLLDVLRAVGMERQKTVTQVALNWIMGSGVIPIAGATTEKYVRDAAGARGWRLTDDERRRLEDAADALGFEFQGTFAKRVDGKFVGYGVEEWRLD